MESPRYMESPRSSWRKFLPLANTTTFVFFAAVNFLNFLDRGIIPGASNEFNQFIRSNVDTSQPDVFLGLLQSGFLAFYSVGCIVFSRYLHYYRYSTFLSFSLVIWIIAVLGSALSGRDGGNYWTLLFFRSLTGVAEAAFQCCIPPLIQGKIIHRRIRFFIAFRKEL